MESQLAYLKSVIEGASDIEPWRTWFERNDQQLQKGLKRTAYLELKLNRIKAIPAILKAHGIAFIESDRYAFLGGIAGRCRDCGATVETSRNFEQSRRDGLVSQWNASKCTYHDNHDERIVC